MEQDRRERDTYIISVVDANMVPFPRAKHLVECGIPVGIAAKWQVIRKEMSQKGLTKNIKHRMN